ATVPSSYLLEIGQLRWDGAKQVWLQDDMIAVAFGGRRALHEHNLLVAREEWLRALLVDRELALVMFVRGERRRLIGDQTYRQPWTEFRSFTTFDAGGRVQFSRATATTHLRSEE